MKKFYLGFFITLLSYYHSFSQILTFSFVDKLGNEAQDTSVFNAANVQQSILTRGIGINPSANQDRFNSQAWTTSTSLDLNDYIEFTVSPVSGYSVTITSIAIQHQASSSGPRNIVLRSNQDGFSSNASAVVTIPSGNSENANSMSLYTPITSTAPVTFRIYAYHALSAVGTWGPGQSTDGNDLQVFGLMTLLPVNFVNIKGEKINDHNAISWKNLTETDMERYTVERSFDGQNFSEIGFQLATQNNGNSAQYTFTDFTAVKGAELYRIKAMQTDGSFIYSSIIKMVDISTGTSLSVYPNPARQGSMVSLQISGLPAGNYFLKMFNASGQMVSVQMVSSSGPYINQGLSVSNLNKGVYFIRMEGKVIIKDQLVIQ